MAGTLIVVGGGPAGMLAGYLFARAGVPTTVLEKHGDFLRDFRGDTIHPSTLDIFDELGLYDALLALPHDRVDTFGLVIARRGYEIADFRRLPGRAKFMAMMPQWDLLEFLAQEAAALPGFTLRRSCEAVGLVEAAERIVGVRTRDGEALHADLVIAADGRGSVLRTAAGLPLRDLGAPIDVFWFRVPKERTGANTTGLYADHGEIVVLIDRGDYYQCGRVIDKGAAEEVRARGLGVFRAEVGATAPPIIESVRAIRDWDAVKLLSVSLDRLTCWHRPGLLAIGDAAHAMSPVGGVGINLAIQDAVAAANILAAPLAAGASVDALLPGVMRRRMLAVRVLQGLQNRIHGRLVKEERTLESPRPSRLLGLIDAVPILQGLPARIVGLGVRREHVRSPDARTRQAA